MTVQNQVTETIPMDAWEVGAELLETLSTGLYSDARDAIREYAQNGIDAGATTVLVTVDGPRVVVRDDGTGMDQDTLLKARRFGMSDKTSLLHVGYRGIGVYSAFGMCDTLTITTKQEGDEALISLQFDFGQMRQLLERDRAAEKREELPLVDVIGRHTKFGRRPFPPDRIGEHFTVVNLDGVGQEYRSQLSDASALNSYLLRTLPIAFPEQAYGKAVNKWLGKKVGLNPVRVVLRIGQEPEAELSPIIAGDVREPEFGCLNNKGGKPIALLWHTASTTGNRISGFDGEDESSGTSGFLLRAKGFTLGNRLTLKPLWPAVGGRTLYHHYTGELHILARANVYPNAARDDLEPSEHKQWLISQLENYFYTLNRSADLHRAIINLRKRLDGSQLTLKDLESQLGNDNADPFNLYRLNQDNIENLDKTERDLERLIPKSRRRRRFEPNDEQADLLGELKGQLKEIRGVATRLDRVVERRTTGQPTAASETLVREIPPEVALLERAVQAMESMYVANPSEIVNQTLYEVETARNVRGAHRAVAALDNLKASGIVLLGKAETSRQELRTLLGWSASGPVALTEALVDIGFEPSTRRERALIRALDSGLLQGLGGRGPRYEAAILSVVEVVSQDNNLE